MMLGRPYKNVNPVKGFVFSYLCSLNIVFVHYTGDRNIYKKTKDILKDADHNGKITTKCLTAFLYSYKLNSFIYFFINLLNLVQISASNENHISKYIPNNVSKSICLLMLSQDSKVGGDMYILVMLHGNIGYFDTFIYNLPVVL